MTPLNRPCQVACYTAQLPLPCFGACLSLYLYYACAGAIILLQVHVATFSVGTVLLNGASASRNAPYADVPSVQAISFASSTLTSS